MASAYGTMDGAYFVGRNELLAWINELLSINYTKVEQCCNGAVYCQIIDSIFPGEVPMKKVNYNAKLDHDIMKNYKVLQEVFQKKQIARAIEVNKLMRGKQMDNLEMLQWLKRYWNIHYNGAPYNAVDRRGGVVLLGIGNKENNNNADSSRVNVSVSAPSSSSASSSASVKGKKGFGSASRTPTKNQPFSLHNNNNSEMILDDESCYGKGQNGINNNNNVILEDEDGSKAQQLMEEVASMSITIGELEKERDFFFAKLREIEIYIQTKEEPHTKQMCDALKQILYSASEEEEEENVGQIEAIPLGENNIAVDAMVQ